MRKLCRVVAAESLGLCRRQSPLVLVDIVGFDLSRKVVHLFLQIHVVVL